MYIYIYTYVRVYIIHKRLVWRRAHLADPEASRALRVEYGQFSKYHVCFCGLDSGNLKFETVRTSKQRICF